MAKPKQSVTLIRLPNQIGSDVSYRVTKAINTTKPSVGEYLGTPDVDALIASGVTVFIVSDPRKNR